MLVCFPCSLLLWPTVILFIVQVWRISQEVLELTESLFEREIDSMEHPL